MKRGLFFAFLFIMIGTGEWYSHVDSLGWISKLNLPEIAIHGRFIPVFWYCMYALLGISFGIMLDQTNLNDKAVMFFIIALILIFVYNPVFFEFRKPVWAFYVLLAADASYVMTILTCRSRKIACLLAPYLLWLAYSTYVNYYIITHNRF